MMELREVRECFSPGPLISGGLKPSRHSGLPQPTPPHTPTVTQDFSSFPFPFGPSFPV